jgi:hypothetical protein
LEGQAFFGFERSVAGCCWLARSRTRHTFREVVSPNQRNHDLAKFEDERRYATLVDVLKLKAAPAAQAVLDAIDMVREMNATGSRKVPDDAPIAFVKARWKPLVITDEGIDRRFYEICMLSELKNSLRSGDIWVEGSRQFRDFEDYLLPPEKFSALQKARAAHSDQPGPRPVPA